MELYIEILGTAVGLIYLWLEYKASIYLWIAGIIMPAIYLFVYYNAGLYADFGINIYYLAIAIYGLIAWKTGFSFTGKKSEKKKANAPTNAAAQRSNVNCCFGVSGFLRKGTTRSCTIILPQE